MITAPLLGKHHSHGGGKEATPEMQHRKLQKESRKACKELCEAILKGHRVEAQDLERLHKNIIKYKNRWLEAPLLHYAVSCRGEPQLVARLLDCNARVDAYATYVIEPHTSTMHADRTTVHVQAIHLAAGLGNKAVLDVLLQHKADVHAYSKIKVEPVTTSEDGHHPEPCVWHDFYLPLHEAAWACHKSTLKRLLQARADPLCKNKDGKTALHLLVQAGNAQREDMKEMLDCFLQTEDNDRRMQLLEATTKDTILPVEHRSLTPLQLAFMGGQFPPELMHELISSHSAVEGMLSLSRVSMSATEAFAAELFSTADKFDVLLGAQAEFAVDKLATLLFTSPRAAVRMLDIFTVEPLVADPQHWPIPCSALMTRSAGWSKVSVICQYQRDYQPRTHEDYLNKHAHGNEEHPRQLFWPSWDFDSEKFKHPCWHEDLVKRPHAGCGAEDGVADVKVKVVMVPRILDVDILWALARTLPKDYYIFARLGIKGLVACVWRGLIEGVYLVNLAWRAAEVLALVVWGFLAIEEGKEGAAWRSSHYLGLCWALLVAAVIRELGELLMWAQCHYRKRCQYEPKGSGITPGENALWKSLWSMRSLFKNTGYLFHLFMNLSLLHLMIRHTGLGSQGLDYDKPQVMAGGAALAFNVMLRFMGFIEMLRVCTPFGRKIVTAMNSLLSRSMLEMAFTMTFIFAAIWCPFAILFGTAATHKHVPHDPGWVAIYLYRALIFGDGDGLDLGLTADPDDAVGETKGHHMVMLFSMAAASGLFQLVVLNLIVNPMYGSEYEGIQQEADLVLERERACYTCMYLMTKRPRHRTYQYLSELCKQTFCGALSLRQALNIVSAVLLVPGLLLPLIWHNLAIVLVSAVLLASGQAIQSMSLMHSDWIGDIVNVRTEEEPQMGVQSVSSEDLFARPDAPRFLWICHRADYNEQWCVANDPIDKGDIEDMKNTMMKELQSLRDDVAQLKNALKHS